MRISIMQPGYLPWLGFFELMSKVDLFVYLDDVQYTVRDWRNRNRIRTKDGWQWLSVPVLHKSRRYQLIMESQINNTLNWKKKHLNALKINYAKAPFFERYYYGLAQIYGKEWTNLCELNIELINYLAKSLDIVVPCVRVSALPIKKAKNKNEKIIGICRSLNSSGLYDSKAASNFIDISLFEKEKIKVEFQDYKHPVYTQVYKPFLPFMSTIDLLFNHGPDSLRILTGADK